MPSWQAGPYHRLSLQWHSRRRARLNRDRIVGLGYGARSAVGADRDIGEDALRHLDPLAAQVAAHPGLDVDGDRAPPDMGHRGVAAHLVADEDRTMEGHAGDGDGGDAALRTLRGDA